MLDDRQWRGAALQPVVGSAPEDLKKAAQEDGITPFGQIPTLQTRMIYTDNILREHL